jgi:hypothetical protein
MLVGKGAALEGCLRLCLKNAGVEVRIAIISSVSIEIPAQPLR